MPINLRAALDFLRNVIGRIMVLAGFLFLVISVLLFTPMYQWLFAVSFFLGVFLIIFGIALHFESFTLKVPSREGWGTILICVSAFCIASALIVALFAVVGETHILPTSFRRGAENIILISLARPNAWLAPILIWAGVGFFVFGLLLKLSREIL